MRYLAILVLFTALLAGCTDQQRDFDGDGLEDGLETRHWGVQVIDLMDRRVVREVASDPHAVDTDGDGLADGLEFFLRTDPGLKDTDADGLTDCQEARHTIASDCERADFDPDAEGDGGTGTDPRKADSDPGPSGYKRSQPWFDESGENEPIRFGDGLSDGDEWNGYQVTVGDLTYTVRSDPRNTDSDGDGLEDAEEAFLFGTHPTLADSDGDQCNDGQDVWPAHDDDTILGLRQVTLNQGANIRVTAALLTIAETLPAEPMRINAGVATDLSGLDFRMVAGDCGINARERTHEVQIIVSDADRGALDLASDQGAQTRGVIRLSWNLDEDTFTTATGVEFVGQVELSGADGSLALHPRRA